MAYHKVPIITLSLYLFKGLFFLGLFSGELILEGFIIGWNFVFQNETA